MLHGGANVQGPTMTSNQSTAEKKRQNILVTGGGGFLGGAIVSRLIARGDAVTSFSRSFHPELDVMGVRQMCGDLCDGQAVDSACKNMDLVFHTAAQTGVWGPYDIYHKTNVTGTENILSACRRNQVHRLVYTSSPSVVFNGCDMEGVDETVPYPDHYTAHYPKTKAIAERAVIQAADEKVRTIILRPHLIWGPRDNSLVPRILARAKRLMRVGSGSNLVDTVYIDNAAEAHLLAADRLLTNPRLSGKVYFITQDDPICLWDMVNAILNAGGLPPVRRSISPKTAWLIGAVLENIFKILRLPGEPMMTRFLAEELSTAHWFDIRAAKRDLGYRPGVSTDEGLKRLEEWLGSNKSVASRR